MIVQYRRLPHAAGLPAPARQSADAAGMDLVAAIGSDLVISPGERALVPTGVCLEIPVGFEGQVRARSGLAWRYGVTVLNGPGTIDADYRGELKVMLINLGGAPFRIERGARVAQLVLARIEPCELVQIAALSGTSRADKGFGSTDYSQRERKGEHQ